MTKARETSIDKRGKGISTGKRKLNSPESTFDGAESKQHNIANLFAQSKEKLQEEPRTPSKRHKSHESSPARPPNTLDTMYNFPSKSKLNTVIDLTATGPTNNPTKSYASPMKQAGFAPHAGAKKLVVKNIRTTPRVQPNEYYEKVWGQLDIALTEIFLEGRPRSSLEELYKGAENVCRQGKAPELYQKLQAKCQAHVADKLLGGLTSAARTSSNIALLGDVVGAWSSWKKQLVSAEVQCGTRRTDTKVAGYYPFYFLLHGPILSSTILRTSQHQ